MPISKQGDAQVVECDKCRTRWMAGTPRPVNFRMRRLGDTVEVVCVKCAPEPLQ
jgi:hypothetical protein